MCGGFTCSKRALIALNILYVIVAITLISLTAYARLASISLVSGIAVCGVFLLIISIVGIVSASKHYQVGLFVYMIVLFVIFIVQFSVACACLAINSNQQDNLAKQGWEIAEERLKHQVEVHFHCCGYDALEINKTRDCHDVPVNNEKTEFCCPDEDPFCCLTNDTESTCKCSSCNSILQEEIETALTTVGGIGLFFSFTEFLGVWLTVRFRNQRDPRSNPSAFL